MTVEEPVYTHKHFVDLARQYLASNPEPTWESMQVWIPKTEPPFYNQTPEGWQTLLQSKDLVDVFVEAGNAKIKNFPATPIRNIRTQHHLQPMALVGKVIALSDVEPDIETLPFICTNCKSEQAISSDGKPPKKCPACGETEFDEDITQAKNKQVYRIQEDNSLMTMVAKDEEQIYKTKPGHMAYGFGILKFKRIIDRGITRYSKFLELAHIESKKSSEVILTNEDIERFNEMVQDPLHYQILVESFAPHIYGLIDAKEVCVITLSSQGMTRPLNSGIFGPPATGKTQLIEYATKLSTNGHFANITNATISGLTSAVEEDPETKMRITKPGLFVMADGGIVGITELQALGEKSTLKVSLNDALERKEVASAKADGAIRLQARCAVLIDSNNYKGAWDYNQTLAENLRFMQPNLAAFLSRLDLIAITQKITDKETNRAIARINFDSLLSKEDPIEQFMEDWEDEQGIPHYGFRTLQKYFAYVTSLPLPPLDKELREKFEENYINAVFFNNDYLVDGRYNRAILLIAKCRARLLLKPHVDESDLQEAIRMVNVSKEIETKSHEGYDANFLLGLKDKQKMNEEEKFWEVVKKCTEKHTERLQRRQEDGSITTVEEEVEYAPESEVQYELISNEKWPESKVRQYIGRAKKAGLLLESYGQGKLTKV